MLFTSLVFLFVFLPVLLFLYYIAPVKIRNSILILFSLLFYAWGGVSYTIILLASIGINYIFVNRLNTARKHKKSWLYAGLIFNISLLVAFKYLRFFFEQYNLWLEWKGDSIAGIALPEYLLPLGISFFTFQQMSLLWDVYRKKNQIQLRLADTALYISFFPQLIAGPIVRYNDIIDQINDRHSTASLFESGVYRFVLGLFRKVVIANGCAAITDGIIDQNTSELTTSVAWLALVSYAFQIYFDFSGYSDMAIGLGRMFGFNIPENFNFPYLATSVRDFWHRWHISLTNWFRDYVYIPLGGNRKGNYRTYFNLLLVFLLTGFWHGASWSFVVWGLFHGLFLTIERLGFGNILQNLPVFFRWAYTMSVVLLAWVFFRVESLTDALAFIERLFVPNDNSEIGFIHVLDRQKIVVLLLAVIGCSRLPLLLFQKTVILPALFISWSKTLVMIVIFVYIVMSINAGSYNPFIYFRF